MRNYPGRAKIGSDDFDQVFLSIEQLQDTGKPGFHPRTQGRIGRVTPSQPYDHRSRAGLRRACRKVLVLGHDDRAVFQRVRPDLAVLGVAQTCVLDVRGLVTGFAKPVRQRRRELRIDQKLHVAKESTAWSTCLAAYSRLAWMSSRSR